jgi:uncharacterized protein YeeX (DUF496 family)
MSYFIYKSQNIANIGGVFPKTSDDEFKLGLGVFEDYYLGEVTSIDSIVKIKEYFVYFLTDEEAEGFKLLNVNKILIDPSDVESKERDLNENELANKALAEKVILKLKLRNKIYNNVGDLEDLISDLSKRLDLLERLVMRTFFYTLKGESVPQPILDAYLPMVESYISSVDKELIVTRADLEDPNELFSKLIKRFTNISNLVKSEYLDKIK